MRVSDISKGPSRELARARILKNMSQSQVADAAHINRGYYSMIERGVVTPSLQILKIICEVLEIEDWKSLIE